VHVAKLHMGDRACSPYMGLVARVSLAASRGPGFGLCFMQYMRKAGSPRDQHAQAPIHVILQYHMTCRVRG
jgi:hypothetical protein